jgi:hypothetical protein
MRHLHAYARLGAALVAGGALCAPFFYFVAASPALTALALSAVLLGVIALLLEKSLPQVPPQAAQLLLKAGLDNLAGLLEELGVRTKALYLPSRLTSGKPMALIPLGSHPPSPDALRPLPGRMLVETGPGPDEVGLLVSTPGTTVSPLLEGSPGSSSSELEAALARVLVGGLDLAQGVLVSQEDGRVTVEAERVRLEWEDLWVYQVIGSPVASVAAAVVADGLDRPVRILDEHRTDRSLVVHLQVVP